VGFVSGARVLALADRMRMQARLVAKEVGGRERRTEGAACVAADAQHAISGTQHAIRGNQWQSEALSGNQRQSPAWRQMLSSAA
jgi:hypothetical protein